MVNSESEKIKLLGTLIDIIPEKEFDNNIYAKSIFRNGKCYAIKNDSISDFNKIKLDIYDESWGISQDYFFDIILDNYENLNRSSIIKAIEAIKIRKYKIVGIIYNCLLKNNSKLQLGKYTFYSLEEIKKVIKEKDSKGTIILDDFFQRKHKASHDYTYVSVEVESREAKKAEELGILEFSKLENILRYMYGILDKTYGIGIINFRSHSFLQMCILNNLDNGIIMTSRLNNTAIRSIEIDNEWYVDLKNINGNNSIWKITNKKNLNEIEYKIMRSIYLIGEAINSVNNEIAFLQFIMAIESIIQIQKDFVTKSIVAQLSETAAFVISDKRIERIEISKLVREIYKTRSAISHGNRKKISEDLILNSFILAKQLIMSFLTKSELQKITNSDQLLEYIENKRYESSVE